VKAINLLKSRRTLQWILDAHTKWRKMIGRTTLCGSFIPC